MTQFYSNNDRHLQSLSKGAQIFIQSLRYWSLAVKKKKSSQFQVYEFYRRYNLARSASIFGHMVKSLSIESFGVIQIDHVNHPRLNSDEQVLLKCLRYIEARDEKKAIQVIERFVDEALVFTFLNLARDYVKTILAEGYSLNVGENVELSKVNLSLASVQAVSCLP